MRGLIKNGLGEWRYETESRTYSLLEGKCIGSNQTSGVLFILDDDNGTEFINQVGFMYMVGDSIGECESYIKEMIEQYEKREHMPNGIARLEHAKEVIQGYLTTNEEVLRELEKEDYYIKVEDVKKDIEYLTKLIEKAKEIQR